MARSSCHRCRVPSFAAVQWQNFYGPERECRDVEDSGWRGFPPMGPCIVYGAVVFKFLSDGFHLQGTFTAFNWIT